MPITSFASGETYRRISEQCERLPNKPASSTLWRWHRNGVRGIRLEGVIIGGQTYISDESLDRFLAAINAPSATEADVELSADASKS